MGNTYLEAEEPIESANAPAGWDDPEQLGTMTLVSVTQAVFRDGQGHAVIFRVRPGATTFKQLCAPRGPGIL